MDIQGFIGPAYTSISRAINAQRLVNFRLEIDQANGKTPLGLIGLPGYQSIKSDFPAAEVRAFHKAGNRHFVVVAQNLYELKSDMSHTLLGALPTAFGHVSIADNGIHMIAVDGTGLLALELATNDTTTSIVDFPYGATFIAVIDNTLLANEPNSQRIRYSAVGDALTWSALDFFSAEGSSDDVVAHVAFGRQLYVLGTDTQQVFWNSGDADRPFIPIEGSFAEVGCVAPRSVAKDASGVYWLGTDQNGGPQVYKASAGVTNPISTPAMAAEFSGSTEKPAYVLEDARAHTFRLNDHSYYQLSFPTTDRTWIYDASTQGWSEFLEWDSLAWHRHRSNCSTYAFNKQIIGDYANGKLYELRDNLYANDGRTLRALRSTVHVSKGEEKITVSSLEVVCEHGVGLTYGQGKEPEMMLRISKDGGFNWLPEMRRTIGVKGEYRDRTRFARPCGSVRDMVVEISISDPVKRAIVKGVLNVN